jgi:hypothetical protein
MLVELERTELEAADRGEHKQLAAIYVAGGLRSRNRLPSSL